MAGQHVRYSSRLRTAEIEGRMTDPMDRVDDPDVRQAPDTFGADGEQAVPGGDGLERLGVNLDMGGQCERRQWRCLPELLSGGHTRSLTHGGTSKKRPRHR